MHEPGRHGHLDARGPVVLFLGNQIEVPEAAEGIGKTGRVTSEDIEPQILGETVLMLRCRIEHHPVDRQDTSQAHPEEGPFTGFLYVRFFEGRGGVPIDRQTVKLMVGLYRPLGTEGASTQAGGIERDVATRFQEYGGKPLFVHVHDLPSAAETSGCILPRQVHHIDPLGRRVAGRISRADTVQGQRRSIPGKQKTETDDGEPNLETGRSGYHARFALSRGHAHAGKPGSGFKMRDGEDSRFGV